MNRAVQPIRRYKPPHYPTCDYLLDHPELLQLVPKRWQKNSLVLSVLSAAAFLIAAGESAAESGDGDNGFGAYKIAHNILPHQELALFAGGGVPMPSYFPEEAARKIIAEEARKAGVEFVEDSLVVRNVMVMIDGKPEFLTIQLDGYDPKHNVAYEFVSSTYPLSDASFIRTGTSIFTQDALDPDFVKQLKERVHIKGHAGEDWNEATADELQRSFDRSDNVPKTAFFWLAPEWNSGYEFYSYFDSAGDSIGSYRVREERSRMRTEPLRAQVRDFLKYLKAQGII